MLYFLSSVSVFITRMLFPPHPLLIQIRVPLSGTFPLPLSYHGTTGPLSLMTDHLSSLAVSRGIDMSLLFTLKPDCSWGTYGNCPSMRSGLLAPAAWMEYRPHPFLDGRLWAN